MGHRNDNDAVSKLRAYARDLDGTANTKLEGTAASGVVSIVGSTNQDDAAVHSPGSGAPHLIAITAAAASVVLVGAIAAMTVTGPTKSTFAGLDVSETRTATTMVSGAPSGTNALRAFNSFGLGRAVDSVERSIADGTTDAPEVRAAITAVLEQILLVVASGASVSETDAGLAAAVDALVIATTTVRPGAPNADWIPPGHTDSPSEQAQSITPPGQNQAILPPGQDLNSPPPGQNDDFVPPGQRDSIPDEGEPADAGDSPKKTPPPHAKNDKKRDNQ